MVSLWPWKGDTSAASFEKSLSSLAQKISKIGAKNDRLRQSARRVKVMWTLYSSFAYILASLILLLVTGWQNWSAMEYSVMAGSPVLIYGIRLLLDTIYEYRISTTQTQLDSYYKERDATIEKLKQATKYSSTQQLIDKYGSQRPQAQKSPSNNKRKPQGPQQQPGPSPRRTNMPPPPTANIQRPQQQGSIQPMSPTNQQQPQSAIESPSSPGRAFAQVAGLMEPGAHSVRPQPAQAGEEFAPNAFNAPPQYAASSESSQGRWYDRVLDVLLGEDEMKPGNRIALICARCRLVNGQAPPGVRTAEDLGRWRCGGCGAWNGVENETKKVLDSLAGEPAEGEHEATSTRIPLDTPISKLAKTSVGEDGIEDGAEEDGDDTAEQEMEEAEPEPPARTTRSKSKAIKNG